MPTINNSLGVVTEGVTTGVLSAENKEFYERTLLTRLIGSLKYAEYGEKKHMPKNEGDTINLRRINSLSLPTNPLTEGVTPDGNNMTITTLRATVEQYGDYCVITDKLDLMGIDPIITETVELLGEQAGELIDSVVRDIIYAGTSVQYAGGKADRNSLTSADVITGTDIKKAVRTLRSNKAKPFSDGYFRIFVDPSVAYDIMEDKLWQDVSKYNGGQKIEKGEIGKIHGAKAIEVSNPKTYEGNGGLEIHGALVFGKGAYAVVDVAGSKKPEIIIKNFGYGDDPLNQRASVGWKTLFTAVRLQELAMTRIECAVSE